MSLRNLTIGEPYTHPDIEAMVRRANRAQLFRDAAKFIEDGNEDRSCYAVVYMDVCRHKVTDCSPSIPENYSASKEAKRYRDFMLGGTDCAAALFGEDDVDSEEAHNIRVLALCFMACAVETEDA
jgi:hypothetical protein